MIIHLDFEAQRWFSRWSSFMVATFSFEQYINGDNDNQNWDPTIPSMQLSRDPEDD